MAAQRHLVLRQRQWLARCDAQLPLDQIEPGDRLRDRVLDLQPGVHLHEVEAQVDLPVRSGPGGRFGDELDRAGAHVADRLRRRHGGGAHLGAARGADPRRRRLLQHLLVTTLHRAVALVQVDAVTVRVGEDLDLDVPRARHIALDQHLTVTETGLGFALTGRERCFEVGCPVDPPHALATAAGAGLDQHRVADAPGLRCKERRSIVAAVVARHQRHAGLAHQRLGRRLAAHRGDGVGGRADEDDAGLGAGTGEGFVLAEEAVARMDGLGSGRPCGVDDALPLQVAVPRRRAAHTHRVVASLHVSGLRIGVGVDRDRANTEPARGGRHTTGDLAAVRNQDLLEHHACGRRGQSP